MKHRKNHLFSVFMGAFMVTMICLMAVPLAIILLRTAWS